MKKLDELQAVRGLAALLVMLGHYSTYTFFGGFFSGGGIGVSIFFILSGIVLQIGFDPTMSKTKFIYQRLWRIVPVAYFCTLIAMLVMPSGKIQFLINDLLFMPNNYREPMAPAAWTLRYELYFYLCFLLCLNFDRKYRPLFLSMIFLIFEFCYKLFSIMNVNLPYSDVINGFDYLPFFILGTLVGEYYEDFANAFYLHFKTTVAIALFIFWVTYETTPLQSRIYTIEGPGALAFIFLIIALYRKTPFQQTRFSKWLIFLGTISYPLYLLNQLVPWILIKFHLRYSGNHYFFIYICTTIFASYAIHRWIEQPGINFSKNKKSLRPPERSEGSQANGTY